MLLIPAIDLAKGRCVRLRQGDFARETRYSAAAHEVLERYRCLGASWVHVVDLDGARTVSVPISGSSQILQARVPCSCRSAAGYARQPTSRSC